MATSEVCRHSWQSHRQLWLTPLLQALSVHSAHNQGRVQELSVSPHSLYHPILYGPSTQYGVTKHAELVNTDFHGAQTWGRVHVSVCS